MSFHKSTLCLLVALLSPTAYAAWGTPAEPSNRVGQFDFGYQISGVRDSLLHVFDDGTVTYFQFKPGANPPVLFSLDSGEPALLRVKQEGVYFTVSGVFKSFRMQSNGQQVVVITYQGDRPYKSPPPSSIVQPTPQHPIQQSSVAVPVAGDVVNETVYRVTLPFAIGKTMLGRRGESELAQIVALAKASGVSSIRIFAPIDPGGTSSFALMRAAEVQRRISRAGLDKVKFQLDTITPEPLEDVVTANIDMVFEKPFEQPAVKQPTVVHGGIAQPPIAISNRSSLATQSHLGSAPAPAITPMQVEPSLLRGSFRVEKVSAINPNVLTFDMSSIGKKMTPAQIARISGFYGDVLAGGRFVVKTDLTPAGDAKARHVKYQLDRLGASDVVVITEQGRQMIEIYKDMQ